MQQTQDVAVVAAQLAATDRRALSQAWYSALHVADRAPSTNAPSRALPGHGSRDGSRIVRPASHAAVPNAPLAHRPAFGVAPPHTPAAEPLERRSPRTELARSIARGLAHRTPRSGAASFAIRTGGGRIQLIVRADGGRTHVVAVCAAALRERVERALAQARFALAARGVRIEVA
jgi:hypothetical protein